MNNPATRDDDDIVPNGMYGGYIDDFKEFMMEQAGATMPDRTTTSATVQHNADFEKGNFTAALESGPVLNEHSAGNVIQQGMDPEASVMKRGIHGELEWYDSDGRGHRSDGPAVITPQGGLRWFRHGVQHRTDGPAIVDPRIGVLYFVNGEMIDELEFWQRHDAAQTPQEPR